MLNYTINQSDVKDINDFFQVIRVYLAANKKLEEQFMTVAERLREQGIQQGMQLATASLVKHVYGEMQDINKVAHLLGLSLAEVKKIISDINTKEKH